MSFQLFCQSDFCGSFVLFCARLSGKFILPISAFYSFSEAVFYLLLTDFEGFQRAAYFLFMLQ